MENRSYYDGLVERSCNGTKTSANYREETISSVQHNRSQKRYRINLKRALIAAIIAGSIMTSTVGFTVQKVVPAIGEKFTVTQELGENYASFDEQYVRPNTYRTQDANHYMFYDHEAVAEGVLSYKDSDGRVDYDRNLYYCLENIDSKNVDEVLKYAVDKKHDYRYSITDANGETHSRNFRYYLAQNNYYDKDIKITDEVLLNDDKAYEKAIKNFKKEMKEIIGTQVIIDNAFEEKEKEYNQKQHELEEMMEEHNMDVSSSKKI